MKLRYPIVLLCASLALMACGEEKKAETAPAKPAVQQTATQATTTPVEQASSTKKETSNNELQAAATDTADAKKSVEATTAAADTTKTELVKPASLEVGKKRYETTCHVCHEAGLLNAPKLGDKENWAIRAKQGVEVLYQHSAKGIRSMPAQATGDVSEAEVYAAVDYMLSQAK